MPGLLQIGANSHSQSMAFDHDPVPWLIARGWAATLVEPQPDAVAKLQSRYQGNTGVRVVQAAVCADATTESMPLYFINGSRTLGSNESDARCLGDAVAGTASFSKQHVLSHQRFYRFTPSQCAACAARLGRALPPTCMKRAYADNLDVLQVPCAPAAQVLKPLGDGGGSSRVALIVIDAEGEDDHVAMRLLEMRLGQPPAVLVYEHSHLRPSRHAALKTKLRDAGMRPYNRSGAALRLGEDAPAMPAASWAQLRRALVRVEARDNSVWLFGGREPLAADSPPPTPSA